jgi:hypothetical protein
MQDRYVGDIGDFAKYGLLRRLAGKPGEAPVRLGIVWCRMPNEAHNNDGRHVYYLSRAEFEELDDELLAALRKIVLSGRRHISAVVRAGVLPGSTVFYSDPLTLTKVLAPSRAARVRHRSAWFDRCVAATKTCDLVFFDPDNGIEARTVPINDVKAGKYIYWHELATFWKRGYDLLVYHHINRTISAAAQVIQLGDRFLAELKGAVTLPLVFRRGSCRVFWLVHHGTVAGTELERRARDFLQTGWYKHFRPIGWPEEEQSVTRSVV